MTWRGFLPGLLLGAILGLFLAPSSGHALWNNLRDTLARLIDAGLRVGMK